MFVHPLALQIAREEIKSVYLPPQLKPEGVTGLHQLFPKFERRGQKCLWYAPDGEVVEDIQSVIKKLLPNSKNYRRDTQSSLNNYGYQAVIVKVVLISKETDVRVLKRIPDGFKSMAGFRRFWWTYYASTLQEIRLLDGDDFNKSTYDSMAQAIKVKLEVVKRGNDHAV